jgi:hypothetical protein
MNAIPRFAAKCIAVSTRSMPSTILACTVQSRLSMVVSLPYGLAYRLHMRYNSPDACNGYISPSHFTRGYAVKGSTLTLFVPCLLVMLHSSFADETESLDVPEVIICHDEWLPWVDYLAGGAVRSHVFSKSEVEYSEYETLSRKALSVKNSHYLFQNAD